MAGGCHSNSPRKTVKIHNIRGINFIYAPSYAPRCIELGTLTVNSGVQNSVGLASHFDV